MFELMERPDSLLQMDSLILVRWMDGWMDGWLILAATRRIDTQREAVCLGGPFPSCSFCCWLYFPPAIRWMEGPFFYYYYYLPAQLNGMKRFARGHVGARYTTVAQQQEQQLAIN